MDKSNLSPGQLIITGPSPARDDEVYYARRFPRDHHPLTRIIAGTLGVFLGDHFLSVTYGAEGRARRAIVLIGDVKVLIPFNLVNPI